MFSECSKHTHTVVPPFNQFHADGLLTDYVFAFYLQSDKAKDGELLIGGIDDKHYTGALWLGFRLHSA